MDSSMICEKIHKYLNDPTKFKKKSFKEKADINSIPFENGIYIIFEKGEEAHSDERIVRIGTHDKPNRLKERLNLHRTKSSTVLQHKIGIAMLYKKNKNDPDIDIFYKNRNNSKSKDNYKFNKIYIKSKDYIKENMTFITIPVDVSKVHFWEEKLIATIAHCSKCKPSKDWLGKNIPLDTKLGDIRYVPKYGLWLSEGINSPVMTENDFVKFKRLINK